MFTWFKRCLLGSNVNLVYNKYKNKNIKITDHKIK